MTERLRLALAASGLAASQNISDHQKTETTVTIDCFYVSLYRFALCLTASHSRAADLVQRTFLNFGRWKHQTQDYSRIERRLFTILHRSYLNPDSEVGFANFGICRVKRSRVSVWRRTKLFFARWRSRRDRLQAESVRETRDPTVTEPECLGLSGACDLPAALAQVNEACRATLGLFYLGNFSVSDIAYILELPIGTVMSNLWQGREQLRSILKALRRR